MMLPDRVIYVSKLRFCPCSLPFFIKESLAVNVIACDDKKSVEKILVLKAYAKLSDTLSDVLYQKRGIASQYNQ